MRGDIGPERGSAVSRRALLSAAAGAATFLGTGIGRADPPIAAGAWDGLRKQLRGSLFRPGDDRFATTKQLFDPRFDGSDPVGVVTVADVADVQAAVRFATANELPIATRAGGHSYVGASATSGALVVDMRKLTGVDVQGELAIVRAGTTQHPALTLMDPAGLALPVGTCPTVGLAGLTFGGGLGPDSRAYGLLCDRLVSAQVVLTGGDVIDVSENQLPDLFWALRGGGGIIGVVTAMTYRTIPAPARDVVRLLFPGDHPAHVLSAWADWMSTADRSVWAGLTVATAPHGVAVTARLVCPAGTGATTTAALAGVVGTAPVVISQATVSHLDAALALGGGTTATPRTVQVAGSDIVSALTPAVAETIVGVIADRSRAGGSGMVLLDPLGGAIADTAPDATAFPWRRHAAVLQWLVEAPPDPAAARNWITTAHRAVAPVSSGAYLNYLEVGTDARRYFGRNLSRLRTIRWFTDPDHRLANGIPR
ncbi:FAD-dependent oxidoreductase [Nocardia stercoris]|uniref:FAD-binding oxidoreductase n=1 Tax=Nocardia stercoris TaxID=2483361 RepID=A0A3M2L4H0_9NOCA|nr:FAD-binding oxidoreductase [Nocardia stercoris]RMI32274.1 FAD-binding oxidoreductase [Nocardia stercoris]